MIASPRFLSRFAVILGAAVLATISGCGKSDAPAPTAATETTPITPEAAAAAAATAAETVQADATTWTPEAMEALLAPIALYPDPILLQVLTAATNPQEVLDAGNWLVANPTLQGKALDTAAQQAGFTAPIRGIIQSPDVVDTMCLNMPWTEELGQAYVNDQAGVTAAVQRLRTQAQDVGTLTSSPQMKVETVSQGGEQAIAITPPSPEVVYVPQYDPVAAYAPPAAAAAPAPAAAVAPATTTTAVTTTEDKGHSTGSMVATGLLSFGAGLLVADIFDDDDDDYWNSNYYGNMWSRPMPYYPPYPYRPAYGNGFYPSNGYNRPPTYIRNGNTVIVNNSNNNYLKGYDNNRNNVGNNRNPVKSPITTAKPNRDLSSLNAQAAKGPKRPAPVSSDAWKGKSGYAGADPKNRAAVTQRAETAKAPGRTLPAGGAQPKVQGTYAGAKATRDSAPSAKANMGQNRPDAGRNVAAAKPANIKKPEGMQKPAAKAGNVDRGRATPTTQPRPQAKPAAAAKSPPANRSAMGGASHGSSDRAASARGKQSAPKGAPPKAKAKASGGARNR